jgi:predicted TIM-barrel fold metal-dependent hydrolase
MSDKTNVTRRLFIQAGAALAGSAVLGATRRATATHTPPVDGGRIDRIDIHHHAMQEPVRQWLISHGRIPNMNGPPFGPWSATDTLAVMDANQIQIGVISVLMPSEFFQTEGEARYLVRLGNETVSDVVRRYPNRFGFFAALPLPYVAAALEEIPYVLDTLRADGICLMAHAGNAYLGDPLFDPVFAELNRRKTVVFTHPFVIPGAPNGAPGIPNFIADFMLDTTRAGIRMMLARTLDRFPNIPAIILPHGGGFLPYIGSRLRLAHYLAGADLDNDTIRRYIRSFHYDTAMWTSPYATPTLLGAVVDHSRILYGTDWNAIPAAAVAEATGALNSDPLISNDLRRQITRANALRLLPGVANRASRP